MKQNLLFSLWLLLLLPFAGFSQDPSQYGTPFSGVPDPRDVNMYQVHTRIFSSAGNLQGVISRLDQIRALGVNTIYLMPHYTIGTDSRASGSPYCIKDFKGVGAEYGSLSDLRQLVEGAHNRGMAVLLDFIVNQTSFDHPWITQHPDWYERDGNGQIVALFPDVAALNMNNTSMRAAMLDAMRYWIFAANVDGYRCDYANRPPLGFWQEVNGNLKSIPNRKILMFAEGDRPENFQAGFDMNFGDKFYYDALANIANGGSVGQIQNTTNTEYSAIANTSQQVVRYTCNHDLLDDAPMLPLTMFKSHNGVVANFLVCAYMRGVPFLMSGQEVDFSSYVPYPWTSPKINWGANTGATADFTKILNFRTSSNAVRRGAMSNYSDNNVCAFTKTEGSEKVVVIANLRNSNQSYTIPAALAGTYKDAYTGATVTLNSGANQSLAAFAYLVLTNTATGGCTPTAITPYLAVNGGSWQQTSSASLAAGGSFVLGPQPINGGSWSWSGPAGFTSTSREISRTNIQTNQGGNYIATYTNPGGCISTQTFAINVTGGSATTYYTIQNRWRPEYYLYDGGNGQVRYSTNPGTNTLYQWSTVTTGNYVLLKNRSTGKLMHVENQNGSVQCTAVDGSFYSAQWTLADAGGGWKYIQNRWQTGQWIHLENLLGYAQYANPQNGWYSAQWQLNNVSTTNARVATSNTKEIAKEEPSFSLYAYSGGSGNMRIQVTGMMTDETVTLNVYNTQGQLVQSKARVSNGTTDYSLRVGLYTVHLQTKSGTTVRRVLVL